MDSTNKMELRNLDDFVEPSDALEEIEVEPDVFYNYFLSVLSVKSKCMFTNLKEGYLERLKTIDAQKLAPVICGQSYWEQQDREQQELIIREIQEQKDALKIYKELKTKSNIYKLKPDEKNVMREKTSAL